MGTSRRAEGSPSRRVRIRLLSFTVDLGYPGIHLVSELLVVACSGANLMNGEPCQFGRPRDRRFGARFDIQEYADDLPDIGTSYEARTTTSGTRPEDNAGMGIHPETFVDKTRSEARSALSTHAARSIGESFV